MNLLNTIYVQFCKDLYRLSYEHDLEAQTDQILK